MILLRNIRDELRKLFENEKLKKYYLWRRASQLNMPPSHYLWSVRKPRSIGLTNFHLAVTFLFPFRLSKSPLQEPVEFLSSG